MQSRYFNYLISSIFTIVLFFILISIQALLNFLRDAKAALQLMVPVDRFMDLFLILIVTKKQLI